MPRKRLLGLGLLLMLCLLGGFGYRIAHQSALNHDLFNEVSRSDPEQVRTLLIQGADSNARIDTAGGPSFQRLIDMLLRRPSTGTSSCPLAKAMDTAVWDANHMKVVQFLLEHHANPDIRTLDGSPAPLAALAAGSKERLLKLFLEHGANPNTLDRTGTSLLMNAVNLRKSSCVEILLKYGAQPEVANAQGDTALMWAAYHGDVKSIALLLAAGVDVNRKNRSNQTALMYALASNDAGEKETSKTVERLVDADADVNVQDSKGCTPFLYALLLRHPTSDLMLTKGGDVQRAIPWHVSNLQLDIQIKTGAFSMSLSRGCTCTPGVTPLMLAAQAHDVGLVHKMLARGAEVNAQDIGGHTALFYAEEDPKIVGPLKHAGLRQ